MIRHLFRLVWNRKRANALLVVEIAVSFVVLFAVVLIATFYAVNYTRPIGFDYGDVWVVSVDVKQESDDYFTAEQVEKMRQVANTIRDMPEVESSAAALTGPFSFEYSISSLNVGGRQVEYGQTEVTDDFAKVLRMDITRGRWFGPEDDAAAETPVVINEAFARAVAPDGDVVGKVLRDENNELGVSVMRVVGVVGEYRKDGEFSPGGPTLFNRANLADTTKRPPRRILVRTRPGTGPDFEQRIVQKLSATQRDWSFEANSLDDLHRSWVRVALGPLALIALVAGFLLTMVGLGLTGVLWQNVTRRRPEIGLRRVQGATAVDVCAQFLGELLVVTTFGLAVGAAVVVQAPILGLTGPVTAGVYFGSVAISAALIYLLTTVCGFYPSWLATRIAPVEALRYE